METILVFVVIPAAIYFLLGVIPMMKKPLRPEPYQLGDPWPYGPVWWSAVDEHGHGGHSGHSGHSGHGHRPESGAHPIGGSASATW
ncbi:aa3-type cytochrome oxidase subunit CtaJ [Hoyosella altamirensis]|uniref:aa3-type cytochrome oxidase subunit CtaJ n=1 Tax=Hoyosella altamirensis TaxID=616997 RepID=UPI003F75A369